jgi:hypothetical protein
MNTIRHDVSEFNIYDYEYYLLEYNGPCDSSIDSSLMIDNTTEQIGGNIIEYKLKKYLYKIKNSNNPIKKHMYELKYNYYLNKLQSESLSHIPHPLSHIPILKT